MKSPRVEQQSDGERGGKTGAQAPLRKCRPGEAGFQSGHVNSAILDGVLLFQVWASGSIFLFH